MIFAVVVGMAVGASDLWVSIIGIAVVAVAAFSMIRTRSAIAESRLGFMLGVRLGLGHDLETHLGAILNAHLEDRELVSIETARQGLALDCTYETRIRADHSADDLVKALNGVEGVQGVQLRRRGFE